MAQFLNQEVDPKAKASAKSENTGSQEARISWDDTTDLGAAAQERSQIRESALKPATTAGASFLAGAQNSIIAAAIRKASAPDFTADPEFDVKKVMPTDPAMKLYTPDSDEIEWLHGSKSAEEYQYRTQEMLQNRERSQAMAANTLSGIAGAIVGDAPLMLAPMGAAGVAGRVGLGIRTAIRAADAGSAIYAADQPGQSATVAGIVAAVSGVDQLFDMVRVGRAALTADSAAGRLARAEREIAQAERESTVVKFDPDAPTKRTAPDSLHTPEQVWSNKVLDTPLKAPIKVLKGQAASVVLDAGSFMTHLKTNKFLNPASKALLSVIEPVVDGKLPVRLTGNPDLVSGYDVVSHSVLRMRASGASKGKTWKTVGDALNALDSDTANVAVHELVHAATARAIRDPKNAETVQQLDALVNQIGSDPGLPSRFKYATGSVDEALAELATKPDWVEYLKNRPYEGGTSTLKKIGQYIMNALGFKQTGSSLEQMLTHFEDLLGSTGKLKQAGGFRSESLDFLNEAPKKGTAAEQAQAQFTGVREKLKQSFALYDNIARGSSEIADLLVSDGAKVGARRPSVTDFKRNLTLEMDARASVVDDAIVAQLKKQGVGILDRYFHRSAFRTQRAALEDKLGKYLDLAYDAEINSRPIPTPDADIAGAVQAYRESGWATKWHEHGVNSGLVDEAAFPKSEYYFPRQYSYDKMRQAVNAGTHDLADYRELFRQALRDIAPDMDSEAVGRVAKEMQEGIWNGKPSGSGPRWRNAFAGASNDELLAAMHDAGIDAETIQKFAAGNIKPESKGAPIRNLKARTRFNMSKEYIVNGKSMSMQDLMDTDVAKVMQGYTNRMSGRVGMSYAGVTDMRQLAKEIDNARASVADPDVWQRTVDDTVDMLLGNSVGVELNELWRGAANLANATMLKNSGLYQLTDTALAMKEFGMARVARSMITQPWFKEGKVALKDKDFASRLDSVLRGNIQKEMRFRWLNTYADNNLDLTRSSNWFNVTQNIGQTAKHANGMSMVHRMQVNMCSGMVGDEIAEMLKGSKEAFTRLEKHGLSRDVADRAIAANKLNPGEMLPPDLQMQVEVVGTRMMDQVVQQIRTGESSAFATLNPLGRIVVGYMNFAVAGTNKILRRTMNDDGPLGLMHLMAYQFPLMYLASTARYAMDGKLNDKDTTQKKVITDAVLNMSAIGGLSLIAPVFTGEKARHSLAAMAYVTNSINELQNIAAGKSDAQSISRVLPLVQEFAPTRAVINNFGEE